MTSPVKKSIELSVVVLCYKAEDFVKDFCLQILQELQEMNIVFEIILVANYDDMKDKTPEIADFLAKRHPEVIALKQLKKGKMGWDMRMGIEQTSGEYIAIIDGDGQMPSSDIGAVYHVIKNSPYDIVKTYRSIRKDGIYRSILSRYYNSLFNLLYSPPYPLKDVNAKPKILSRKAIDQLNLVSNDWFTDAEIMIQALHLDMQICEIATVFKKNERRASFVSLRTALEFLVNLIKYRFF